MSFYDELTKEAISQVLDPVEEATIESEYNATMQEIEKLYVEAKEALQIETSLSKAVEGMQQHPEAVAVIAAPTVEAFKAFTKVHIEPTKEGFKEALANIKEWLINLYKQAKRYIDKIIRMVKVKLRTMDKDYRESIYYIEELLANNKSRDLMKMHIAEDEVDEYLVYRTVYSRFKSLKETVDFADFLKTTDAFSNVNDYLYRRFNKALTNNGDKLTVMAYDRAGIYGYFAGHLEPKSYAYTPGYSVNYSNINTDGDDIANDSMLTLSVYTIAQMLVNSRLDNGILPSVMFDDKDVNKLMDKIPDEQEAPMEWIKYILGGVGLILSKVYNEQMIHTRETIIFVKYLKNRTDEKQ